MAGVREIASSAGVDAELARRFVDALIESLLDGERVTIRGLGSIERKTLPERTFKTALMKSPVTKPERSTAHFKPSKELVQRLNHNPSQQGQD